MNLKETLGRFCRLLEGHDIRKIHLIDCGFDKSPPIDISLVGISADELPMFLKASLEEHHISESLVIRVRYAFEDDYEAMFIDYTNYFDGFPSDWGTSIRRKLKEIGRKKRKVVSFSDRLLGKVKESASEIDTSHVNEVFSAHIEASKEASSNKNQ